MQKNCTLLIIFILCCSVLNGYCLDVSEKLQSSDTQNSEAAAAEDPQEDSEGKARPRTDSELKLSWSVLIFGFIILAIEAYLIKSNNLGPELTVRLLVITLIIVGTLFLITAGYSSNQIAAGTGLLGTIAGYVLGRINSSESA